MQAKSPHGAIDQSALDRKNDYLYRISVKSLIKDESGSVLVVKEANRTWWDLPGGGMDHGEDIKSALARELHEEVGLVGDFAYHIIDVDDPIHLGTANVLQVRLVFEVIPEVMPTSHGIDANEIAYLSPRMLNDSENPVEKKIYGYARKTSPRRNTS